ncbi:hypothetical protein BDV19DRAFT_168065 [Aspergillus venezuelensis]
MVKSVGVVLVSVGVWLLDPGGLLLLSVLSGEGHLSQQPGPGGGLVGLSLGKTISFRPQRPLSSGRFGLDVGPFEILAGRFAC